MKFNSQPIRNSKKSYRGDEIEKCQVWKPNANQLNVLVGGHILAVTPILINCSLNSNIEIIAICLQGMV